MDQFPSLVESGHVRFGLLGGVGPRGLRHGSIASWVQANGTLVSSSAIHDASGSQSQLYDLGPLQAAASA